MATKLKLALVNKDIKQGWLAEQVGISQAALSSLVQGKTEPTLRNARKIAKVLGVSIEELWPDTDSGDDHISE